LIGLDNSAHGASRDCGVYLRRFRHEPRWQVERELKALVAHAQARPSYFRVGYYYAADFSYHRFKLTE
jgi:hypothetical protein